MQLDPPRHTGRLLLATFIASFAVISVERAAYFFTSNVLGFSNTQNLLLALGFGVTYVIGSLTSHKLAMRFGEKRMLMAVLVLQAILHTAMASYPVAWMLCVGNPIAGLLYGSLWPLFESYVAAGRSTRNSQRTIWLFNLASSPANPQNQQIDG
jgi:MFS family permease